MVAECKARLGFFWYCGQGLDRKCTSKVSWSECERASVSHDRKRASVCSWFFCCLTGFSECQDVVRIMMNVDLDTINSVVC